MLSWLKEHREKGGMTGAVLHLSGWLIAISLSVYWWRAWKHLLDGGDPFAKGWMDSGSWAFGWIHGLLSLGAHMVSDPLRLGQLILIGAILYLTLDRTSQTSPTTVTVQKRGSNEWLFWTWLLFKK